MAQDPDFAALARKAEQAVESIKDPELKRVAFEKILDNLLSTSLGGTQNKEKESQEGAKGKRKKKAKGAARQGRGPKAHIKEMIKEDFFKTPKTIGQVKAELENRGHHIPLTSLSGPLQMLCQDNLLRRTKGKAGGKQGFVYTNR
jgi:hypothetical protein